MSISRKLMFWIILVVFSIGILSTYIYVNIEMSHEQAKLQSLGNTVGLIVEASLDKYMTLRDFSLLEKTFRDLGNMKSIERVLLLNNDGVVKAATDKKAVGLKLYRNEPQCGGCHGKSTRGHYMKDERIFRWIQPIRNKPECFGCHGSSPKNNGVFIIDFSLSGWAAEVKNEVLMGLSILTSSLVLIGFVMLYLTRTLIISRLATMAEKVRKFRAGEYDIIIPVDRDDEIARLEKDFNEMAETINSREIERGIAENKIRRNYDMQSAINAILQVSLENFPMEEVLEKSLNVILSIEWLSVDSRGGIFLVEGNTQQIVLKAQKGLSGEIKSECAVVPFGKCLCGTAALTRAVQFASELDERHVVRYKGVSPHGHYCIPIVFSGRTLGVINLYLTRGHDRNEMEIQFLQSVSNVLAGIIQRKRIEQERETLIQDLQITLDRVSRSQKMWQETFDSIGDLISVHDREFNVIRVNRAFASYFGFEPRRSPNKKCYDFFRADGHPCESCPQLITLDENRPVTRERLDAETGRIFLISTFPFRLNDSEFSGTIHIAKDITEERGKEMRLMMSERLAALGQMASGIAHEINNPLASIAGCTEGLLNRVARGRYDPELFQNYLRIMEEEVMRCKKITTGMLSFVREASYEKKKIDLNQLIEKALEIIGFQGRLKDIRVLNNSGNGIPPVVGNEGELKQVFLSIVTNALDCMNNTGTLTIETGFNDEIVFAKIGDSGPGIASENINRIFDPFFTTKSETGGTGLGLSIASKIISNHSGKIHVETELNKGTVFSVSLPRQN